MLCTKGFEISGTIKPHFPPVNATVQVHKEQFSGTPAV